MIREEPYPGLNCKGIIWKQVSLRTFVKVDEKGYRYVATLCIPDGAACYNVRLDVSKEGSIVFSR